MPNSRLSRGLPLRRGVALFVGVVVLLALWGEGRAETSCERRMGALRDALGAAKKLTAARRLVVALERQSGPRRARCAKQVEPLLRGLLLRWGKASVRMAAAALTISDLWLRLYAKDAKAPSVRLLRAAKLYQLKRWKSAALAYGALAGLPAHPRGQRVASPAERAVALRRAVLCWQKLHPGRKPSRPAGRPRAIAHRRPMFAAFDGFVAAQKGKRDAAAVLYRKARVLYEHDHLVAAVRVFGRLVKRYPKHPLAASSAQLLLEALRERKKGASVATWLRRLRSGAVAKHHSSLAKVLGKVALRRAFRRGQEASAAKRWRRCVAAFVQVAEQTREALRPMALHNGALCAQRGKDKRAAKLWGQLLREHAAHPLAQRARYALAAMHHQARRHERAAELYEAFARRAPKNDGEAAQGLLYAITVRVRKRDKVRAKALLSLLKRVAPARSGELRKARDLLLKL